MMWVLGLRRHVLAVAIGLLPLLAACGDSDDGHSRSTPTRTTVVAATATRTTASNPATPTTGPAHTSTPTSPPIPTNTPPTLPTVPSTATPTNPPAPTATATLPAPTSTATALEATSTATPVAPTSTATPTSTTEATPTPTEAGEPIDLTGAVPAAFAAHGSVEQVYVTDAEPGTLLELLTPGRRLLQSGTTDSEGVLLFRNVRAAAGYVVIARGGEEIAVSGEVTVRVAGDPPPQSFYDSQLLSDGYGYLTVRDGIQLAINVRLPTTDGPYPTVVEYSGYDPANPDALQPSSLISSALGYAVVGVNMRGTGCSGGAFDFFETLQSTDGYDVIEIVAAQPWVKDHTVGMVGLSYPGISQLFVAQLEPPHLSAIAPLSVIAEIGDGILYPGGILNNGFAVGWAEERQHDAQPFGQGWSKKRRDLGDQVCIDNQALRGQSADLMAKIRDNPFYVPAIADPVSPITFVDKIKVPVFLAGGWQDEQTGPYFANMLDRFTGTDKVHFTMTNGNHTEPLNPAVFGRWMEFIDLFVAHRIPMRHALARSVVSAIGKEAYGIPALGQMLEPARYDDVTTYEEALARWENEPRVRVLFENGAAGTPGVPGTTIEVTAEAWPLPSIEPTIWYFDNDGKLISSAPTAEGADSFLYDPDHGQVTSFHGGTSDVWKQLPAWDWKPIAAGSAAVYETDPLPEGIAMAGSGSIDLWLKSTADNVDTQVTISEVYDNGKEVYVQSGWLRANHRQLNEDKSTILRPVHTHLEVDAEPLPAGEFAAMRIELYPFAHAFHAGSRLRLAISSPGGDRPHWKFESLPADGEVVNTIAHSPTYPSRIVLPVLPDVEVDTPLPPCPGLRGQPCRDYVTYENTPEND